MSRQPGGYIGFTRVPAASGINSAASGMWTLREAEAMRRAGTWPSSFVNPASIAGLQLWLDAADSATLFDATSGGSAVAADGGVARWEDKSGNARHATQSTAANRPARKTAIQGGKDVLRFDGSSKYFSLSSTTVPASHTVFFVFTRATSGIHSIGLANDAEGQSRYAAWWFTDNIIYEKSNSDFSTQGTANTTTGAFLLTTTRNATTSIAVRRNASQVASVTSGSAVTNAASGTWDRVGYNASYHNGDLCEIIAYNTALSDTDRANVESYLMSKWGIT